MSTPLHAVLTGTFTSTGAVAQFINLPTGYNQIKLVNITDIVTPDAGATTQCMWAEGYSSLPAGAAYLGLKTNGAATTALATGIAAGGFTFVQDTGTNVPGPVVALTPAANTISQAAGAVALTAAPPAIGSIVRMINTTGMLNIAGWDFTVTAINAGVSMTLGYLDTSGAVGGFGANGTNGSFRVLAPGRYYPRNRRITNITRAASAVITMSVAHGFTVGQQVRISVPAGWGMTEINGLIGTITAITTGATNTITVNIDSTGFTAFTFPTSAVAALGTGAPEVTPVGEAATVPYQNLLDDSTVNQAQTGVIVGTGILAAASANKVYQWVATSGVSV